MELSKKERKKLRLQKLREASEQARLEHEKKKEEQLQQQQLQKRTKQKTYFIAAAVALLIILAVGFYAYSYFAKPGKYDDLAKCLTEKGAVMYGATWCKYTQAQKAMFGKSFKHVNYKDFSKGPNIEVTPTWIIDGKRYERVQSFEDLAYFTGCEV